MTESSASRSSKEEGSKQMDMGVEGKLSGAELKA